MHNVVWRKINFKINSEGYKQLLFHTLPSQISELCFHRITEWLMLEGTSRDHLVQPPAQAGSPRARDPEC